MDELRNMLRQSFSLPVEKVGVVDEKKVDGWVPPDKSKNYSGMMLKKISDSNKELVWRTNFGNMFEPLFALSIAYYFYNGIINSDQILGAVSRLSAHKEEYDYRELFKKLSPEEIAADKMRSVKSEIGRSLVLKIKEKMDNFARTINPDNATELKPIVGKVEEIPNEGKMFYVAIHGYRLPHSQTIKKVTSDIVYKKEEELIAALIPKYKRQGFSNPSIAARIEVGKQLEKLASENRIKKTEEIKHEAFSKLEKALNDNPNVYDTVEPEVTKNAGGSNLYYLYKVFDDSEKDKAVAFANRQDIIKEGNEVEQNTNMKIKLQMINKTKEKMLTIPTMQYLIDHKDEVFGKADAEADKKKTKDEEHEEAHMSGYGKLKKYIGFIEANIKNIGPVEEAKRHYEELRKTDATPPVIITTIGSEGMEEDTKGEIKGDVSVTVADKQYRISLKAGNRSVASIGKDHIFYEYMNSAITYAGLNEIPPWSTEATKYSKESKKLSPALLDVFQRFCIKLNSQKNDSKRGNRCNKLLFCILDTLAHGLDDATLVSLTTTSGEIKTLSPSISEYIRAMNAETEASKAGNGTKFSIFDMDNFEDDEKTIRKSYGIMTVNGSGKVEINGDLEDLLKDLKNVFGPGADEDRKMIWAICRQVSYSNIIKQKVEKLENKTAISSPITTKLSYYHSQINHILSLYKNSNTYNVEKISKVSAEDYVKSLQNLGLYDYAFGKVNKVDEKNIHTFLVGMATKLNRIVTDIETLISTKKLKVAAAAE